MRSKAYTSNTCPINIGPVLGPTILSHRTQISVLSLSALVSSAVLNKKQKLSSNKAKIKYLSFKKIVLNHIKNENLFN